MSYFRPVPDSDVHGQFLQDVVDILFKNVVFASNRDKVVLWKRPQELQELFDFTIGQSGVGHEKLLTLIKSTIKFSVKTGHPYFINQLFSGWVQLLIYYSPLLFFTVVIFGFLLVVFLIIFYYWNLFRYPFIFIFFQQVSSFYIYICVVLCLNHKTVLWVYK